MENQETEKPISAYETILRADCKVAAAIASNLQKEHAEILADILQKHSKGLHPKSPLMRITEAIRPDNASG